MMAHISHHLLEGLLRSPLPQKNWPRANEAKGSNKLASKTDVKPLNKLSQYAKTCSKQAVMSLFNHGFIDTFTTEKLFKANPEWRAA